MSPESDITWLLLTSPASPKPPLPSPRSAGLSQLLNSRFSSTSGLLPPTLFLHQASPTAPQLKEPTWLSTPGQGFYPDSIPPPGFPPSAPTQGAALTVHSRSGVRVSLHSRSHCSFSAPLPDWREAPGHQGQGLPATTVSLVFLLLLLLSRFSRVWLCATP